MCRTKKAIQVLTGGFKASLESSCLFIGSYFNCFLTGKSPVYRYFYERPRWAMRPEMGNAVAGLAGGVIIYSGANTPKAPAAIRAVHSAEIGYALGNLPTSRVYSWQPEGFKVSAIMQELKKQGSLFVA